MYTSATDWSRLWSREKALVRADSAVEGPDQSCCLKIESGSAHGWGMWSNTYVEILPGDRFVLSAQVRREGAQAGLTLRMYGEDRRGLVRWNFALPMAEDRAGWQEVQTAFTVPESARWMRIGLTGRGKGTAWFDDVTLVCEKKA